MTTIFVLPPLIVLPILAEFNVWNTDKHYQFLKSPTGLGVWLIMIGCMIIESQFMVDFVFAVILTLIGLINISLDVIDLYDDYKEKELEKLRATSHEPVKINSELFNSHTQQKIREIK
jgi:hypothetical protein